MNPELAVQTNNPENDNVNSYEDISTVIASDTDSDKGSEADSEAVSASDKGTDNGAESDSLVDKGSGSIVGSVSDRDQKLQNEVNNKSENPHDLSTHAPAELSPFRKPFPATGWDGSAPVLHNSTQSKGMYEANMYW